MFIKVSEEKIVNLGAAISAEWGEGEKGRADLMLVFPGADTDEEGTVLPLVELVQGEVAQRAWAWLVGHCL